jgi:hypothetical protein
MAIKNLKYRWVQLMDQFRASGGVDEDIQHEQASTVKRKITYSIEGARQRADQ